jgi:Protein of unknown function (Hypoth_ymh)
LSLSYNRSEFSDSLATRQSPATRSSSPLRVHDATVSRASDNGSVLSFEIHGALADLAAAVYRVTDAAADRAPVDEIDLRVDAAVAAAGRLDAVIGPDPTNLRRHLHWLRRRHREGHPELSDGDVRDLREHDLPERIQTVVSWSGGLLDAGLVDAVLRSWQAQEYDSAVRSAFVHLEQRMREVGSVDPAAGLTARRLVSRLLPGNDTSDRWSEEGFMGSLPDGEQGGARELLNGSFSLFRNATAHRSPAYTREEAEDVIHLVNLCLRLVAKISLPPAA